MDLASLAAWPPACSGAYCQPVHTRFLQGTSVEQQDDSPTCRALRLSGTCCIALTAFFPIVMLLLFGLTKVRPWYTPLSLCLIGPMCFWLMWLVSLEYLMCVLVLFIMSAVQFLITLYNTIRRRILYGAEFLRWQPEDGSGASSLLSGVFNRVNGRSGAGADGSLSINDALRQAAAAQGVSSASVASVGGRPSAGGGGGGDRVGGSPEFRRGSSLGSLERRSMREIFEGMRDEVVAIGQAAQQV